MKTIITLALFLIALASPARAQGIPGDNYFKPLPTPTGQHIADWVTTGSVAGALAKDTWDSLHADNKWRAVGCQALKDGIVIGASEGLKALIHQRRPDGSDLKSFPSEHTGLTAAVNFSWGLGTGLGRVAANKHYFLSNVLPGLAIGAGTKYLLRGCR